MDVQISTICVPISTEKQVWNFVRNCVYGFTKSVIPYLDKAYTQAFGERIFHNGVGMDFRDQHFSTFLRL